MFFCTCFVYSSALLNSLHSPPSSAEKEKVNPERKGLAPGRGSLTDSAAPSLPSKKPGSSGGPASLPVLDISDGSGNNSSPANSPESSHNDGEPAHWLDCVVWSLECATRVIIDFFSVKS